MDNGGRARMTEKNVVVTSYNGAFWDLALSQEEVAALEMGVSPLLVKQDAIVEYWPGLEGDMQDSSQEKRVG